MLEGHVEITLSGHPATLVPSLGAALELSRRHQNFGSLLGKLETLDLAAAVDVVRLGLGRPESEYDAVAQEVFEAGLLGLMPSLCRFIFLLANGGRPPRDEEAKGDGAPLAP